MVLMMRERASEMAPFTAMVMVEACTIALTVLAKTAITAGMSPFVFVVYTNAVGSLLLLPFSLVFHPERTDQSLFTFPLLVRIFLLGLTGTTKADWSSTSSQAQVIGTLVSVIGAIAVELYKGPFIRKSFFQGNYHQLQQEPTFFVFYSAPDRWVLGGVLLAAASLSVSIWNIIQAGTVKLYPQVMKVASFYSLVGTSVSGLLFVDGERLKYLEIETQTRPLTRYFDFFGSIIRSNVHLACTRMKGPFYVPMFKPFGIVFATAFGVTFCTNSLHYGSVMGTLIIGAGYYTMMWGQIKEEEQRREEVDMEKPLLLEKEEAQVVAGY
ncbi:Detected protein of unknown function [Hibiscus syriacus]|uniref:WAT1-related protein n=1 Tax=Hibiscus syriacus TaxID=106335 RepID=A0A6A2ZIN9_HIBSY|nr:Detected protein of unknown function [Hibiscus syriacus]